MTSTYDVRFIFISLEQGCVVAESNAKCPVRKQIGKSVDHTKKC